MNTTLSPKFVGVAAALAALFVPCSARAGLLDLLFGPYDLETTVVSDLTDMGRLQQQPTKDHPLYYHAISAGYHDFGGLLGGDKPIARTMMNDTVMKVLAKQGYLPASKDHRPDIIVAWTWGTLYVYRLNAGGDPSGVSYQVNEYYMRWFLGGAKLGLTSERSGLFRAESNPRMLTSATLGNPFPEYSLAPGLEIYSGPAQRLVDTARQNLYVAVVAAYKVDLDPAKRGQLLWMTRISAPARGFWMPDAMPPMVAIAGPYFGRETSKPVWIMASEHFKPDIQIGDPRVVEYLKENQGAVANVGASK